jgi:hypothetical protein
MKEPQKGDMCLRCKSVPILDERMPYCSGCRKILQDEIDETIREGTEGGVKKGFFTYFPNGKKMFFIKIPGIEKKHKK